jgi:hypothetical protein
MKNYYKTDIHHYLLLKIKIYVVPIRCRYGAGRGRSVPVLCRSVPVGVGADRAGAMERPQEIPFLNLGFLK